MFPFLLLLLVTLIKLKVLRRSFFFLLGSQEDGCGLIKIILSLEVMSVDSAEEHENKVLLISVYKILMFASEGRDDSRRTFSHKISLAARKKSK